MDGVEFFAWMLVALSFAGLWAYVQAQDFEIRDLQRRIKTMESSRK